MKIKKTLAVGLTLVTALSLSACGIGSNTATPAVTVTKTVVEPAPAPAVETFSVSDLPNAVRLQDPYYYDADDASIIELATTICTTLQGGASVEDVALVVAEGLGADHATAIIAGAIVYICPDQKYKVGA